MPEAERAQVITDPGCAMCADIHLDVNPFSFLVAELKRSNVRLARNQFRRGWTIVALRRHATELFDLAPDELAEFWHEVALVARALSTMYRPVKINYAVLGNRCPHVHCHLVLHFQDDDPEQGLNMNEREVLLSPSEYERIVHRLRTEVEGNELQSTTSSLP
jgi:diadenosine tetraphosphate (Ap4A) HIT family hydrolase